MHQKPLLSIKMVFLMVVKLQRILLVRGEQLSILETMEGMVQDILLTASLTTSASTTAHCRRRKFRRSTNPASLNSRRHQTQDLWGIGALTTDQDFPQPIFPGKIIPVFFPEARQTRHGLMEKGARP